MDYQTHPVAAEIKNSCVQSRNQIRTMRIDQMHRVARVSEIHPLDPYAENSYYARWLISRMNFFGLKFDNCDNVIELEKKYCELL